MEEQRRHIRLVDDERCHLRLGDLYYLATIKNISLSGALLHFYTPPERFQIGDNCQISLDGGNLYNYNCEVVRVETSNVAMKFIGIHSLKEVEH
ncbi:PilZ domain-containing protein [Geobacter sp. AOG2]|uniref:PilZ domain-containing protein n=1 Tax=Geobacter sp. AOG2 TaxID=1566347 RepID=UPI001CC5562F